MGCCETVILVVQLILEFADLIADWLFAVDVHYLEPGLVYGRHNQTVVGFIFFFAAVGTFTFLLETSNSIREHCGVSHRDRFVVGALILWIEDISQAILSLVIAVCREDGSSRFQLAKAGVAIVLTLAQLSIVFFECHQRRKQRWNRELKTFQKCALALIIIGLICNVVACVAVFILSHTHVQLSGALTVREPTSDFEERYDDRYFFNVSIYLYDPSFQSNVNNENSALWMKVTAMNSLRESTQDVKSMTFQYRYQDRPSELRFSLWSDVSGFLAPRECYTLTKMNSSITAISSCNSSFLQGTFRGLSVQLVFKPPEVVANVFRKTIYGDIVFGVRSWDQGPCKQLSVFQNALPKHGSQTQPAVHYFRSSESSGSSRHLVSDSGRLRFYKMANLTDVESIWKTGWTKCSATGHVAPQLDPGLAVQC